MKIYEIKDLVELLKKGDLLKIKNAAMNITKTVRCFVADSNPYLNDFGLHIIFEVDNSISEPFAIKEDNSTTILINPNKIAYKEDGSLNTFDDLELPLAKTITGLLVTFSTYENLVTRAKGKGLWKTRNGMKLNNKTLEAKTPIETKLDSLYKRIFNNDGKQTIEECVLTEFNLQTDYLKYRFLVDILDEVQFTKEYPENLFKLNQLVEEAELPLEAFLGFQDSYRKLQRTDSALIPDGIFEEREGNYPKLVVDPILTLHLYYSTIKDVFRTK